MSAARSIPADRLSNRPLSSMRLAWPTWDVLISIMAAPGSRDTVIIAHVGAGDLRGDHGSHELPAKVYNRRLSPITLTGCCLHAGGSPPSRHVDRAVRPGARLRQSGRHARRGVRL